MKKKGFLAREIDDYKVLIRNVPTIWFALYVMAVILMNILANKELINFEYLALDCGFALSWLVFLCDDMMTKRFGAKASVKLTILAFLINLFVAGVFFIMSIVHWGHWGQYYIYNDPIIDEALNATISGTWYVLLGSSIALIVSSAVNSIINVSIGKICERSNVKDFKAFAARAYISTAIGQFVDNFLFASIVSYVFFGWTALQVLMCSLTGAAFELFAEIVLSPVGYRVSNRWEEQHVGVEYIYYAKRSEEDRRRRKDARTHNRNK